MKILALEFSSVQRSVAAVDARPGREALAVGEVVESGGQGTRAMGMIREALTGAQMEREEVECILVGLGPGSYTGIRAAIAIAQGWQLGRGVRLAGISSADCVAAQAAMEGVSGSVAVVIDAQRGEFYAGTYEIGENGPRPLQPLKLARMEELREAESAGILPVGPEVTRWFSGGRVVFPRASVLVRLGAGLEEYMPGEKLEPIYLRQTSFVKAPPPRILPP